MDRINNHFSFSHSATGAVPLAHQRIPEPQQPAASGHPSASAGTTLGKRTHPDVANYVKQSRRKSGPAKTVEPAITRSMSENYQKACASLTDHVCQKIPVPNNVQEKARRKKAVEQLVGEWNFCLNYIDSINGGRNRSTRRLILTRMLEKVVQSEAGTYEQACETLRTVSSLKEDQLKYLTEKAQAYYRDLKHTDCTLPEMPAHAYNLMTLMALHEELESQGFARADLADIANAQRNSDILLVFASDIMNQPPFTSGNDDERIALMLKIARQQGSVTTIFALVKHFPVLQNLGFSLDQALRFGGNLNVATTIEAIAKHYDELIAVGFSHKQIEQIASQKYAATKIQRALEYGPALLKTGMPSDWVVRLLCASMDENSRKRRIDAALQRQDEQVDANGEQEMNTAQLPNEGATAVGGESHGQSASAPVPHTGQVADEEQSLLNELLYGSDDESVHVDEGQARLNALLYDSD